MLFPNGERSYMAVGIGKPQEFGLYHNYDIR